MFTSSNKSYDLWCQQLHRPWSSSVFSEEVTSGRGNSAVLSAEHQGGEVSLSHYRKKRKKGFKAKHPLSSVLSSVRKRTTEHEGKTHPWVFRTTYIHTPWGTAFSRGIVKGGVLQVCDKPLPCSHRERRGDRATWITSPKSQRASGQGGTVSAGR